MKNLFLFLAGGVTFCILDAYRNAQCITDEVLYEDDEIRVKKMLDAGGKMRRLAFVELKKEES